MRCSEVFWTEDVCRHSDAGLQCKCRYSRVGLSAWLESSHQITRSDTWSCCCCCLPSAGCGGSSCRGSWRPVQTAPCPPPSTRLETGWSSAGQPETSRCCVCARRACRGPGHTHTRIQSTWNHLIFVASKLKCGSLTPMFCEQHTCSTLYPCFSLAIAMYSSTVKENTHTHTAQTGLNTWWRADTVLWRHEGDLHLESTMVWYGDQTSIPPLSLSEYLVEPDRDK